MSKMRKTLAVLMALLMAASIMLTPVIAASEEAAAAAEPIEAAADISEADAQEADAEEPTAPAEASEEESEALPAEEASGEAEESSAEPQEGSDEMAEDIDLDGAAADDPNAESWVIAKRQTSYLNVEVNVLKYDPANLPLETLLELLAAQNESFSVPDESAVIFWCNPRHYYYNNEGYRDYYYDNDIYELVERDGTVDVSRGNNNYYMIVGSGHQLNREDVKYSIYVTNMGDISSEDLTINIYKQNAEGNRESIGSKQPYLNFDEGEYWNSVFCNVALEEGEGIYLGVTSEILNADLGVSLKVYDADDNDITDQILNQDMTSAAAGYLVPTVEGEQIAELRFEYSYNGETLKEAKLGVRNHIVYVDTWLYDAIVIGESGDRHDLYWSEFLNSSHTDWDFIVYMTETYPMGTVVNLVFNAATSTVGEDGLSHIAKAVIGDYDSLGAAAGAEDIKDKLFGDGYPVISGETPITITIFTSGVTNGQTVLKHNVSFGTREQTVPDADVYFSVYSANNAEGNSLRTSTALTKTDAMAETYQTVFVLDPNADLSQIKPVFNLGEGCRAHIGGTKQVSGETTVDFSKGQVQYVVDIPGERVRNYFVEFIKVDPDAAKLFVQAPSDEREVFLITATNEKHDIAIANIGSLVMTGLNVKLEDAQNVKLDAYYTVGGDGNDKLDTASNVQTYSYGDRKYYNYNENGNAVIRLVPDGEGEIKGTLVISADGQEDVRMKLTGFAKDPVFTTTALDDAVKYVPYSYLVATNNIYDWIDVQFSLAGRLPEGVSFYPKTGEIYGVAQETGEFPVTVTARYTSTSEAYPYTFQPSTVELVLVVKENTNENVYNETDEGYAILDSIGTDIGGYDFVLEERGDQLFRSEGELSQFVALWLNGEKLVQGQDYEAESGSTKVVIYAQTFENKANQEGYNTLAAEFRLLDTDSLSFEDSTNELRKTAQNFRLEYTGSGGNTGGNSGGNTGGNTGGTNGGANGGSGSGNSQNQAATVTCSFNFVDADGNPASGLSIELRSTPRKGTTSAGGRVSYSNVEMGEHTLSVLDESGNAIASKTFTLKAGSKFSANGDELTVVSGSTVSIPVTYDGSTLTFGNAVQDSEPQTGDTTQLELYAAVLAVCAVGLGAAVTLLRRRGSNR